MQCVYCRMMIARAAPILYVPLFGCGQRPQSPDDASPTPFLRSAWQFSCAFTSASHPDMQRPSSLRGLHVFTCLLRRICLLIFSTTFLALALCTPAVSDHPGSARGRYSPEVLSGCSYHRRSLWEVTALIQGLAYTPCVVSTRITVALAPEPSKGIYGTKPGHFPESRSTNRQWTKD